MSERSYIRDGAEIYRRSFAIIRAESDLARFNPIEERVAVRINTSRIRSWDHNKLGLPAMPVAGSTAPA